MPPVCAASSACSKRSRTIWPWPKTFSIAWPATAPISPWSFAVCATLRASPDADANVRTLFADPDAFDAWAARWRRRLAQEGGESPERRAAMRAANPAFIPRNHLVEEAIVAAVNNGDFSPFETLLSVITAPYADQPAFARYAEPPRPDQVVHQTFCGT